MKVKVYLQWWDGEEIEVDPHELEFTQKELDRGGGSLTLDNKYLDIIIPGMKISIEIDGSREFSGKVGRMTDSEMGLVTFMLKDWMQLLGDRKVEPMSGDTTTGPPHFLESISPIELIKRLFKSYTGKTATDSDIDIESFVHESTNLKEWKLGEITFIDAIKILCEAASVSDAQIGFSAWIDGYKRLHIEPRGRGKRHGSLLTETRDMTIDPDQIINRVHFRGGIPKTLPWDGDAFTEHISTGSDITVTVSGAGTGTPTLSTLKKTTGTKSLRLQLRAGPGATAAYAQAYIPIESMSASFYSNSQEQNPLPTDWSDGGGTDERPVSRLATNLESSTRSGEGNFTLEYILVDLMMTDDPDGASPVDWSTHAVFTYPIIMWIVTEGGAATGTTWDRNSSSSFPPNWIPCVRSQFTPTYNENTFNRVRFYPYPTTDSSEVGGSGTVTLDIDVTKIKGVVFEIYETSGPYWISDDGTNAGDLYVWLDGLRMTFHEIHCLEQDTGAMVKYEVRERSYQNRDVINWLEARDITKGILASHNQIARYVNLVIPFNVGVQINDVIPVKYYDKIVDLRVKTRKISISPGDPPMMDLRLGKDVDPLVGIINRFRVINDTGETGGNGFKLSQSWADTRCNKICEVACELTCQLQTNQTLTQLLTDQGVELKDPCKINCQNFVQLD